MYFPVCWPKQLRGRSPGDTDGSTLVSVAGNRDRTLFAVLTECLVSIWFCKPPVQTVSFKRSEKSVEEFGANKSAEWKPDSTMVAVVTDKGYILFYKLEMDTSSGSNLAFVQREIRRTQRSHDEVGGGTEAIPSLRLEQSSATSIHGGITCMVCLRDELMVSTPLGTLHRVRWDGSLPDNMSINIQNVEFSVDLQHSRASPLEEGVYFRQIHYSPLLGGFAAVLSNGQAAFLTSATQKFDPIQVQAVKSLEITNATSVSVNHKYMLMSFGCSNGEGAVCSLDELTGALVISHRLRVSTRDFPDAANICGEVTQLKWTPDGCALALAWKKGGFSVWSVFGALLLHSMGSPVGDTDPCRSVNLQINSMEWGIEGYHLWVISNTCRQKKGKESPRSNGQVLPERSLVQLNFIKSALTVNPCMSNHEHLFLQGEDKLYLNIGDTGLHSRNHTTFTTEALTPEGLDGSSPMLGNKQWQIIPIPHTYLSSNWPIRYSAVDRSGHCVAVAGKTGLAHYTLFARKWKLFGNEMQERDMVVSGGLTWWKDFICVACYNLLDQRDEIRFYPRTTKLDNTFVHIVKVPSQILLLNTFRDILVILCADCHIMLFHVTRKNDPNSPTVQVTKSQEVAIGNFIPHPATAVALTLTPLRTETASMRVQPTGKEAESIILNVAGKLLMFQRDRSGPPLKPKDGKERPLPFCAPVMVASSVENMWFPTHGSGKRPHLAEALWLSCGAAGMKVWIPLHPKEDSGKTHGFMSKRIMLPFHVDVYPLAVLFEAGLILGATSAGTLYQSVETADQGWPYLSLERTSQIHLHHILRQLLRRNLGVHALDIARTCTDLNYFPHVLELLLHEVLEEEATSKDPIPDPLLPRVVAFVQEFPEFLQTVVHCARKTEVALWPYLFSTVGNPKDLFEECLISQQLTTAASYLIILQNLEKPMVSKQHATLLLDSSLEHSYWDLARDLVRFLRAIDPNEAESPHATKASIPSSTPKLAGGYSPPLTPHPSDSGFVFGNPVNPVRGRSVSIAHMEGGSALSEKVVKEHAKEKVKPTKSASQQKLKNLPSGSKDEHGTPDEFFIDMILSRHARKLLSAYRLRDLGCFAANVKDYQLVAWLRKERLRAAKVEDFVKAIKQLHDDFQWPFPLVPYHTLQKWTLVDAENGPTRSITIDTDINGIQHAIQGLQFPRDPSTTSLDASMLSAATADVMLQPRTSTGQNSTEEGSYATTEQSDTSSAPGEVDLWPDTVGIGDLEKLSHELANKGPLQSDSELRYLLQIFLEAGCLEWAIVISILLRDAMSVVRVVNTASMTDAPLEMVGRMREGLSFLELWADTECFGYKTFLTAIKGQSKQLDKIAEQAPPKTPRSRHSSCSTDGATGSIQEEEPPSPPINEIKRSNSGESDLEDKPADQPSSYECAIS